MKLCTTCRKQLSPICFSKDKTKIDGLSRRCKQCASEVYKKWKEADPERAKKAWRAASRTWSRTRKYNLTELQLIKMVEVQDNKCAICGLDATLVTGANPGLLQIDHDHDTGLVRGLLCNYCNAGLGFFKDDIMSLLKAVEYLKQSKLNNQDATQQRIIN